MNLMELRLYLALSTWVDRSATVYLLGIPWMSSRLGVLCIDKALSSESYHTDMRHVQIERHTSTINLYDFVQWFSDMCKKKNFYSSSILEIWWLSAFQARNCKILLGWVEEHSETYGALGLRVIQQHVGEVARHLIYIEINHGKFGAWIQPVNCVLSCFVKKT